jgi:hypothetical protein
MKRATLLQLFGFIVSIAFPSLFAMDAMTSEMAGDFLNENKILEGSWLGGQNFTPNLCPRGFYTSKVDARAKVNQVKMDLASDNVMDVYGSLVEAYGRVEGEYLGDYSACQNAWGWLGVGIDRIDVRAKITVPDDSSQVTVRVYSLKLGRIHLGEYVPQWFEGLVTDSINQAFVYVWETRLGDWLNQNITYYFNSIKDKRGL